MLIAVFRFVVRLATLVVFAALAVAGLATAVFACGSGDGDVSLPGLLRLVHAPQLLAEVHDLLRRAEAPGVLADGTVWGGALAIVFGLVLIAGALAPRTERLVVLDRDPLGALRARRRALAAVAVALAEQLRVVHGARVRVRGRRWRPGARLTVRADRAIRTAPDGVSSAVREQLGELSASLPLAIRVSTRATKGVE